MDSSINVKSTVMKQSMISYEPPGENQLRLIHLHAGHRWDYLRFDTVSHSLEPAELPFYEAVSYAWDSPELTEPADCSGQICFITKSARDVLEIFLFSDRARLLWIDALCINQADPNEKSHQIALMDVIYQRASRVLVFLGKADEDSDKAMETIAGLIPHIPGLPLEPLLRFFTRPWFNTVWVLQEVALADTALLICGSKCVPWGYFPEWWARNRKQMFDHGVSPPPTMTHPSLMLHHSSLLQLLHGTRDSDSAKPHDKVYGVLGLLSPEERSGFLVDYTQAASSLFTAVATTIIRREQSLQILSCVYYDHRNDQDVSDSPSWVSIWDKRLPVLSLGLSGRFKAIDAGENLYPDSQPKNSANRKLS